MMANQRQSQQQSDQRQGARNPLTREPKPPYPAQHQQMPGLESKMNPQPDYGEDSYTGSGKLQGKVALITGADSGIGRAVALAFAREGADILISYWTEESDAQETLRAVKEAGRRGVVVGGDIGDENHCQQLVQRVLQEFGRLDILVNNAGFQVNHKGLTDIPSEQIERVFRTNILAMFWLCKAALPHMQAGSCIINTASIEAYQPKPPILDYASTKGAVVTFTKGLALETVKQGIRVNAVAPGPVWTPLIVASGEATSDPIKFGADSPMKRPAQPAELAPAYVFLASPGASYVNGEILGVTGGEPLA
jgi:NAD(P)-dependent dehydrogenase (short-subunit alcohol dehydrogenase family)